MRTDWADDIRGKLSDYRQVAPDFSAEDFGRMMSSAGRGNVESRAPGRSRVVREAGRRRRTGWILIPAGAALAVVAVLVLSVNHRPAESVDTPAAMAYQRPASASQDAIPMETLVEMLSEAASRSRQRPYSSVSESSVASTASVSSVVSMPAEQSTPFVPVSHNPSASPITSIPSESSVPSGHISLEEAFPAEETVSSTIGRPRSGRISSKIYVGGGGSAGNTMSPGLAAAQVYGDNVHDACKMNATYESFSTTAVDVHHRRPLRGGVSLHYVISGRWGIESGVLLSYHESEITATIGSSSYSDMQRQAFIGIPLNVVYEFACDNDFRLYLTAGGLAEKMLWSEDGRTMRPLQYSLNGGVGLSYRLSRGLSFFAEPGVRYSFDNGADFRTVYSDHPFGFDFRLGVKVNL